MTVHQHASPPYNERLGLASVNGALQSDSTAVPGLKLHQVTAGGPAFGANSILRGETMGVVAFLDDYRDDDTEIPTASMAKWMKRASPNDRLPVRTQEGHFLMVRTMRACEWRGWVKRVGPGGVEDHEALWFLTDKGRAALTRYDTATR